VNALKRPLGFNPTERSFGFSKVSESKADTSEKPLVGSFAQLLLPKVDKHFY
jgi:hypothetical protein